MFNLAIKAYQFEDGTVRFIYQVSDSSDLHIASCEDYTNMVHLMKDSGAIKLDNSVNLYDYRRELYREVLKEDAV